jgi:uncharacterized glyoxalase superfamily protein PhnB
MTVKPIPVGYHTITPFFPVRDAKKIIRFLKLAFDAEEKEIHTDAEGKIMNAQLKIGDSFVMVGEVQTNTEESKLLKSMIYMYVEDVDSVYKKAVKADGKSIMEPMDQFYGDRNGAVEDPAGNQWWIATHIEDLSREEIIQRTAQQNK